MAVDSCPRLAISCDRVLTSAVMSSAYHLKTNGFLCKKNTKWEGSRFEMWEVGYYQPWELCRIAISDHISDNTTCCSLGNW